MGAVQDQTCSAQKQAETDRQNDGFRYYIVVRCLSVCLIYIQAIMQSKLTLLKVRSLDNIYNFIFIIVCNSFKIYLQLKKLENIHS